MNLLITACLIITIIMVCTALLSVTVYFFNKLSKDVVTHIEYTDKNSMGEIHFTYVNFENNRIHEIKNELIALKEVGSIKNLKIWQEVI